MRSSLFIPELSQAQFQTWGHANIYIAYKYWFLLASSIFVMSDNWFWSPGIQKIGLLSEIVELKEN